MSQSSDARVTVPATPAPALSVVIPTHQRRESLRRALDSLARQTLASERYEVIVSVDGSTDGTLEMLTQVSPPFHLVVITHAPCGGRAPACNRGIRASRGEVVLILDDDMEPSPELLEAHLRLHGGSVSRGVLGAVPVVVSEPASSAARFVAAKFNTHLRNLARPGARLWGRAFYSGNFSVPRATILSVGLYSESFTTYGNEDVELSLRLHDAGVALVFAADAVARQHYEKSLEAFFRDQISKGRTAVLLERMRPDPETKDRLSSHTRLSRAQRAVLQALLVTTALVSVAPEVTAHLLGWLDRKGVALERLLPFASEYFFRVGAGRESRAPRSRRPGNDGGWWRGHSRRAVATIVGFVLISVAPFVAGYFIAPRGLHFTGAPTYAEDIAAHEAFAAEMASHAGFDNLLTPDSTAPGWFVTPLEAALGLMQKATKLPYMALLSALAIICAVPLAFALMALARRAQIPRPGLAAVVALLAGTLSPLLTVPVRLGLVSHDFVATTRSAGGDATPIFAGPGLNLLLSVLVLVVLPTPDGENPARGFRRSGLAVLALAAIYPFFVPTLVLTVMLCALAWAASRGSRRTLGSLAWFLALAAAPVLYWSALPRLDAEFARFASLNWRPLYSPAVVLVSIGLGVGAIIGVPRLLRGNPHQQMLACFTLAWLIAIYVPSHAWRSHLFYLSPILVIASIAAWWPVIPVLPHRLGPALAAALVAAAAVSLPYYYSRNLVGMFSFARPAYLTDGDVDAIQWIAAQPNEDVVLAPTDVSPWIAARAHHRVLVGHYLWTHEYSARRREVDAIFEGGANPQPLLKAARVHWIVVDTDRGVPAWARNVAPAARFGSTRILLASAVLAGGSR